MSGSSAPPADHRRKWDVNEYEQLAKMRDSHFKKPPSDEPVKRELLKRREYKVDLEGKIGKAVVVTKNTPQAASGGYWCDACDCVVKDSINFLDHINGKKHQKNLGMSMKVERSTLDQVKERFARNKGKMEEKKKDYHLEERVKDLQEEEQKNREYQKEQKRAKKRQAKEMEEGPGEEGDADMMAMMGFSGFGTSSKR